jgi:DNA-binding response OmpR family regulator
MMETVLIVEDDQDLGQLLKQYLELNGFAVVLSENGIEGRTHLREQKFDIILTDVMMPKEDGFTFAAHVVQTYPALPILFITARKLKEDVIKGLKIGADDYITKPFDADELVLRIRNILKRSSAKTPELETMIIGNYTFYPKELLLEGASQRRVLTEREAELLQLLTGNIGQLVRKRDILNRLWKGNDFFNGRSMDVFVSRLRKYLSDDPRITIESVRGAGIRLMIN